MIMGRPRCRVKLTGPVKKPEVPKSKDLWESLPEQPKSPLKRKPAAKKVRPLPPCFPVASFVFPLVSL